MYFLYKFDFCTVYESRSVLRIRVKQLSIELFERDIRLFRRIT